MDDGITTNDYPTLEAAHAAEAYFANHGLTVRPGGPVKAGRARYAVAYATPGGVA